MQAQFESQTHLIDSLEESKDSAAKLTACVIGLLGTGLLGGAMFSYLAAMIPLMIVLAIPAFIGWIVPYFASNNLRKKKTDQVVPLIDQKYDKIYEVCEKGNGQLGV